MNSTSGYPFGSAPFDGQDNRSPFADPQQAAKAEELRPRTSSAAVTAAWMLGALLLVVVLGVGIAVAVDASREGAGSAPGATEETATANALAVAPEPR